MLHIYFCLPTKREAVRTRKVLLTSVSPRSENAAFRQEVLIIKLLSCDPGKAIMVYMLLKSMHFGDHPGLNPSPLINCDPAQQS